MSLRKLLPSAPAFIVALAVLSAAAKDISAAPGEPRLSRERAVLHTSLGDVVIAFYQDVAPRHTAQILKLMKLGVYDSIHFYRVEPGFLVQLSDARDRQVPLTPEQDAAIKPIKAEFSAMRHVRGVVSLAREDNDPDSGTTSFSILLADAPHLDGKYTIFGRIERGWDALDAMVAQPLDGQHRPLDRISLDKVDVVDAKKVDSVLRPAPAMKPRPPREEMPRAWLALVAAMSAVGLAIFFTAGKIPPNATACLGMLNVLIGYFLMFLVLAPRARENSALAVAVFVGSIAVFKAMSFFERAR